MTEKGNHFYFIPLEFFDSKVKPENPLFSMSQTMLTFLCKESSKNIQLWV